MEVLLNDAKNGMEDTVTVEQATSKRDLCPGLTILFILPSPRNVSLDGFPDRLRLRLKKNGIECEKTTIDILCNEANTSRLTLLSDTLVLLHGDAFIELIRLQREEKKEELEHCPAKRLYRQLSALNDTGHIYPSLSMLFNTQDKVNYMGLMQKLGVETAETLLPEADELYLFCEGRVCPSAKDIQSFFDRCGIEEFVFKGSPSGHNDHVQKVRNHAYMYGMRIGGYELKDDVLHTMAVDNVDTLIQMFVKHCGYDICTYWKGTQLLYVLAIQSPVFSRYLKQSPRKVVFIHPQGNVEGGTLVSDVVPTWSEDPQWGDGKSDSNVVPSWSQIEQVKIIGERILTAMNVQPWDFVRLDFLYQQGKDDHTTSRLLLSDIDSLGCYIGHNLEHDIRESFCVDDIVECLKQKLQSLVDEQEKEYVPKRRKVEKE